MKNSFALIYVLLFTVLIGVTVFTLWATNLSDLFNTRRHETSAEGYQLAKSALDEGWVEYKQAVGTTNTINQQIPASTCSDNKVIRINLTDNIRINPDPTNGTPIGDNLKQKMVYDYKVCFPEIIGIGYFKGDKIRLKGTISHNDQEIIDPGPDGDPLTLIDNGPSSWNHDNDIINFVQTGS